MQQILARAYKSRKRLTTLLLLFGFVAVPIAQSHEAPVDDGPHSLGSSHQANDGYRRDGYRRDGRRRDWNRDWDSRWSNNWGNVWNDSDVHVRKDVRRDYYDNATTDINTSTVTNASLQNKPAQWSSIPKPGNDIPNFHEVHPWLFRGGQPTQAGLQKLYDSGIRHVINLRSDPREVESERQLCDQIGLRYTNIPLTTSAAPTDDQIDKFMSIVDRASHRSDHGAVFVHCHYGADRTGCMVALYRELHDNEPYAKARSEMLQYGFHPTFTALSKAVSKNAPGATSSN